MLDAGVDASTASLNHSASPARSVPRLDWCARALHFVHQRNPSSMPLGFNVVLWVLVSCRVESTLKLSTVRGFVAAT